MLSSRRLVVIAALSAFPIEVLLMISVFDNDLKATGGTHIGHSHAYFYSLSADNRVINYFGHSSFSTTDDRFRGVFELTHGRLVSRDLVPGLGKFDVLIKFLWGNLRYSLSLLRADLDRSQPRFFVNTHLYNVLAILVFSHFSRASSILYLQSRPGRLAGLLFRTIGGARGRVTLAAENSAIAERYSAEIGQPVVVVPSVVDQRTFELSRRLGGDDSGVTCLRGAVLGAPRIEKGHDLLTDWLADAPKEMSFDVQVDAALCPANYMPAKAATSLSSRLCALAEKCPNVSLIAGPLSMEDYLSVLDRANFVILPYRVDAYAKRSSGIFFEALAAGKPVLLTEGLAVQREAERSGAAVFFRDGDAASFLDGLGEMLSSYSALKERALAASRMIECTHSPKAVVSRLLEIVALAR